MVNAKRPGLFRTGLFLATVALTAALAGCAPRSGASAEDGDFSTSDDTAVMGEYAPYDPAAEAEHVNGKAIEGSEEEELQQERIAGGAVGAVTSSNLEPLEGIVDCSEGEYEPVYGMGLQAPEMPHESEGRACLSCHEGEESTVSVPKSHIDSGVGDEECLSCHAAE